MTGLPVLASHYSGIGMKATIKVYAKRADVLVLEIQTPKYVDINQVLRPKEGSADTSNTIDGWNWRNLNLPPLKKVGSCNHVCISDDREVVASFNLYTLLYLYF